MRLTSEEQGCSEGYECSAEELGMRLGTGSGGTARILKFFDIVEFSSKTI